MLVLGAPSPYLPRKGSKMLLPANALPYERYIRLKMYISVSIGILSNSLLILSGDVVDMVD